MSVDLIGLCQQALDLTFRQRLAIKQGRWDDLQALLDLRGGLLAGIPEHLAAAPDSPDRISIQETLAQISEHDATNQRLLTSRSRELLARLGGVRLANRALSGYQGALRGNALASGTFDRQR